MDTEYSKVFEELVDTTSSDPDLTGLLAYALYKNKKRDWVIKHKLQNNGEAPTREQEKSFENTIMESDYASYKNQAENFLIAYSNSVLQDATPGIREEALKDHLVVKADETLSDAKKQSDWLRNILLSAGGSFLFSIILAVFAFIVGITGSDIVNALKPIANKIHHP